MAIERRPFDVDPLTGDRIWFHYDHSDDSVTIERVSDVEPILEASKRKFNDAPSNWKGDVHHIAEIPMVIVEQLIKQGILYGPGRVRDMDRFKAWLNDRDNRMFRTRPGRV